MANVLKVDSATMEELVNQFKTQAANYQDAMRQTDAAVKELGTWWTGDAYNKFAADWERAVNVGNQQVQTLEATATAIQTAAQNYETTEAGVASAM